MTFIQSLWHSFETWALGWGGLTGLIGICLLLLWFFTPPILSSPAAKATLLNIGLGCLAFSFISGYFIKVGFQSCVDTAKTADEAAIIRKNQGIQDIEKCGVDNWDITTGTCKGPQ